MTAERSGLSVAAALWVVAFAALGMAAFTTRANEPSVISLTCVGHAYTGLALLIDRTDREAKPSLAGRTTTIIYLSVLLVIELAGMLLMLASEDLRLALWFALGVSFSAVGIVVTWGRVPSDNVLTCQLFFHTIILAALFASVPVYLIELGTNGRAAGLALGRASMSLVIMVFCVVALPLLLVSLATVLAYNLSKPKVDQDLPWAVMTAHQAILAVLIFRWAVNGL